MLSEKKENNQFQNKIETRLISCCKNENYKNYQSILNSTSNVNAVDNEDRNAAMYLVEQGRFEELQLLAEKNSDLNYKNRNGETLPSILVNKFKEFYYQNKSLGTLKCYVNTLTVLVCNGCNFNVEIDKEGNTPLMFFMAIGDLFSATYILEKCSSIDLSLKNNNNINASYLSLFVDPMEKGFQNFILRHPNFDYGFVDVNNHNCNLLMYFLYRGNRTAASVALDRVNTYSQREKLLCHTNDQKETPLILAAKFGLVFRDLIHRSNINCQDHLGNTALFYAIKIRDVRTVNMLVYHGADPKIQNHQGVSAFDAAVELGNKKILEKIKSPVTPEAYEEEVAKSKKGGFLFFDKKKTKDEKLDDYIQQYQINQYKENYKYLLNKKGCSIPRGVDKNLTQLNLVDSYLYLYKARIPRALEKEMLRNQQYDDGLYHYYGKYNIRNAPYIRHYPMNGYVAR